MALGKIPASPTLGRTSTAKKVAASVAGKYEAGAIETKIAVAQPKVERPASINSGTKKFTAPVSDEVTEVKEKKVATRTKVKAEKPETPAEVKSVAAEVKAETKAAAEKKPAAKKATAAKKPAAKKAEPKAAAEKKPAAKKATAAKKPAAAKKAEPKAAAKKATAAKKPAAKKATAAKKPAAAKKAAASIFEIQLPGGNITAAEIEARVAAALKENKVSAKSVDIYVKPEDNKIYTSVDITLDLF